MQRILLLVTLYFASLLLIQAGYGQIKEELPLFSQINNQKDTLSLVHYFQIHVGQRFRDHYRDALDAQDCNVVYLGVRFQVNTSGKVYNLVTSTNTPDSLKDIIEKELLQTGRYWSVRKINGVAVDSDPIIITYYLSIEPNICSYACDDLGLLLSKASFNLPALQFSEYQLGDSQKPRMHGTLYDAGIIRIQNHRKGDGR